MATQVADSDEALLRRFSSSTLNSKLLLSQVLLCGLGKIATNIAKQAATGHD